MPAVIAYRGGEKFAGLVPIINELPDDADLSALTLEAVMKRFAIPPTQRVRILLIAYTDTRSLPELPAERRFGASTLPLQLGSGHLPFTVASSRSLHQLYLIGGYEVAYTFSGTRRRSETSLGSEFG